MMIVWAAAVSQLAIGQVPAPTVESFMSDVENKIRGELVDPESARFEWPYELKETKQGYYTCGRYNAKNSLGGYAGFSWFSMAVRNGQVFSIQTEELSPWIGNQCAKAARKGELTPRA